MRLYHLYCFSVLSACSWALHGAAVPGVTVTKRTESCCKVLNIPIDKSCLNTFSIEDRSLALVHGTEVVVQEPFHFLTDENVMQVLDCVNFIHQIDCDVDETNGREEIVDFEQTPCHKQDDAPNAATVIHGSDLTLLIMALLIVMFR